MCAHHAEKHPEWRNFQGHVVEEDSVQTSAESGPPAPLNCCLLHGKHEIKLFCVTCGHGVCQQCVTRGHKAHDIQDVEQLVDRRRAILKSNNVHDAAADAIQMETKISQRVTEIGQDIDRLQHESERASSTITDTFDEIEKMVRAKREGLLAEVDKLAWRFTEPLEQQRRRLEMFNKQYTTARLLATALASSEEKNCDVLTLGKLVDDTIAKLTSTIREEYVRTTIGSISAVVQKTAELESYLEQLAIVQEGNIDLSRTTIDIPDGIYENEEANITVTFFPPDDHGSLPFINPLHGLTGTLIGPSGDRQAISLPLQPTRTNTESMDLKVTVKPIALGRHVLELRQGRSVKEAPFTAGEVGALVFDPMKCSRHITLSGGNKIALSSSRRVVNVMTTKGYTEGKHRWAIKLGGDGFPCVDGIGAGVSRVPEDGDYSTDGVFFSRRRAHYWWGHGCCHSRVDGIQTLWTPLTRCTPWQHLDVIEFTLDCDRQTLELHLRRTGERSTINNVVCDEPLYPTVCLGISRCSSVELV